LVHWKARLHVAILSFLLFIVFLLWIAATFIVRAQEHPPLSFGILLLLSLLWIFKKWGNFILSANLLALAAAIVLVKTTFDTGGLYSDNLLWLMIAPLLALLFADRISGFCWLILLVFFTSYLFFTENNLPGQFQFHQQEFDNLYFFISYSGLFVMVVGIVLVFASGQAMIIEALNEKHKELIRQKEEISQQAQSLREAEQNLITINRELEQFAYAASHDLKEPLRMIKSYTQLIRRRMNAHIDETSSEYIAFVTDGVTRMDKLLSDLLEYSRLGRNKNQNTEIDLNDTLLTVMNNLMVTMIETQTTILSNPLPVIHGSSTEMMQLFQNLVANAIKFRRKEDSPRIEIIHKVENGFHVFRFKDNGIGIPEESKDRVFNIFERLHGKEEYEGTGIGLATCKKIVNHHGGDIWVDSQESPGTTFTFTVPCQN
jgi:signal transduction histidine kinase